MDRLKGSTYHNMKGCDRDPLELPKYGWNDLCRLLPDERRTSVMTRDEVDAALMAQPFDTDVQVDVCGVLVDVVRVDYDANRDSVVFQVIEQDATEALGRLLIVVAGMPDPATRYGERVRTVRGVVDRDRDPVRPGRGVRNRPE